jgi:uncharacterized protein YbjQ (UPF0145 family)
MSSEKKDLTRIEELGEYLHELNNEEESFEPPVDLPIDENSEDLSFENTDSFEAEEPTFGASEETAEETSEESTEEIVFDSSEDPFVSDESTDFSDQDFTSADFSSSDETPVEEVEDTEMFSVSDPDPLNESLEDFPSNAEEVPLPAPMPEIFTPPPMEEKTYKAPETFEDLKKFAESSSFAGMGAEGNPSFSVLIKNVRYLEDVNDILLMLKELGLMSDSEEQTKARLMRGQLLVPRISEYAAIFLAHKLRRFDIDIQVGLSDEIHPPKHQEMPETGIVSRHSLYQNQTHYFNFNDPKLELSHIIVAATSNLEGHQVIRYLGVASEHKMLEGHIVEDEGSDEIPHHYSELAQKLKAHALKAHANAVIGLNYQLTPLPSEYGMNSSKYRLSCTGNLVWVNKL